MCGMYLFLAMLRDQHWKAEKPVLAATAKIKAVDGGRRKEACPTGEFPKMA